MSYTVVKIKSSYKDTITLLLKELMGFNTTVIEKPSYIIYKHDYENIDDIKAIILSLSNEQMIDIFCYTTITKNIDLELKLVEPFFEKYHNGFYTFKEFVINEINNINKNDELDLVLNGTGISKDFVVEFLKYDLNLSKAAKEMYIHRNTMIYKLDKLKEISGFDLRSFKDSYVLYSLIINE